MFDVKTAWCTHEPTVSCQDIYSVLSPITWICRIAGIFPLTLKGPVGKRKYTTSCVLIIYSLAVLVLFVTGLYGWTDRTNERRMKLSQHPAVQMSTNLEIVLEISSIVIMVAAAILCQDKFANAIDSLSLQDISLRKLGTKFDYAADLKQYCIRLAVITLITAILVTYDFIYEMDFNMSNPLNWIFWISPNITRTASTCLFVDIIIVMKQRFSNLNEHLQKMIKETKESPPATISTANRMCDRIHSISEIHGSLCEIASSINYTFGYNTIVGVIYALEVLTSSTYYFLHEIGDPNGSYVQAIGSVTWAMISFGPIVYMVMACNFTQAQASLTGKLMHKFKISAVDTSLNNAVDTIINILRHIQSFSMQLHHEKIEFSGAGLFPLDATLIQSIAGAVTTYVIILIQFDT